MIFNLGIILALYQSLSGNKGERYAYYQEWIRKGREYPTPLYMSVKALFGVQSTPA